eukprot:7177422-Pyramimonas_sp.AAC.1
MSASPRGPVWHGVTPRKPDPGRPRLAWRRAPENPPREVSFRMASGPLTLLSGDPPPRTEHFGWPPDGPEASVRGG